MRASQVWDNSNGFYSVANRIGDNPDSAAPDPLAIVQQGNLVDLAASGWGTDPDTGAELAPPGTEALRAGSNSFEMQLLDSIGNPVIVDDSDIQVVFYLADGSVATQVVGNAAGNSYDPKSLLRGICFECILLLAI